MKIVSLLALLGFIMSGLTHCGGSNPDGTQDLNFKVTAHGYFLGSTAPFDPNPEEEPTTNDPFEPCSMVCAAKISRQDGTLILMNDKILPIEGGCNSNGPTTGTQVTILEQKGVQATLNPEEAVQLEIQCLEPSADFLGIGEGYAGRTQFVPNPKDLNEFSVQLEEAGVQLNDILCSSIAGVIPTLYLSICGIPIAGDFLTTQKFELFGGFCRLGFDGVLELAEDLGNCPRCGNGLLDPGFDEECENGVNEDVCGSGKECINCFCECPTFFSCDAARNEAESFDLDCSNNLDLCCELILGPGSTCADSSNPQSCCTPPEIIEPVCGDGVVSSPYEDCDPNADPEDLNAFCLPEECGPDCFCNFDF